ncbi:sugar ABC transporter ATP-binding protein [Priestia koreensis]|uniref:sugar ABC transporter ATP-binding protein n=1 Tax=Priestia koreensis TaxID=284581 RepID=UPI003458A49D
MTGQLNMQHISKHFGSFQALKKVSFDVKQGEVHALLGANGAGKSTLMKILCGAYDGYEGEILLGDKHLSIHSPADAKREGIQIVHQEVDVALIPSLTVAENILLDVQASKDGDRLLNWRKTQQKAKEALQMLGSSIDVKKDVSMLTLSEKQQVLIARAIIGKAAYLILDEPTAPLSIEETKQLFRVIKHLTETGVGVIYISHRLQEVFEIADRITVLRDGEWVTTVRTKDTSVNNVITSMLGKTFSEEIAKASIEIGEDLLRVQQLSWKDKVKDVSLQVREGEVVGIAGLVGAGKTELCRSLFGLHPQVKGSIHVRGKKLRLTTKPHYYIEQGIALVPEERRKEGILVEESISSNLTLPSLQRFTNYSFVKRRREEREANTIIQQVGIKTNSTKQAVGTLSGGNQQKVAIGKWLLRDADVYLFDEPTKGVDVGSKQDIFELIQGLAKRKKGVLYATCEFNELLGVADRIYVMYDGQIVKELTKEEATHENLFYYAAGGK